MRLFLLFVLTLHAGVLLPAPNAQAQTAPRTPEQLGRAIDDVLASSDFDNAFWGVHVFDLQSGRVLYERNAGKSFVPASNMKLYTSAAALSTLGADFRYRTLLYADGPIENGVLRGNLIIRGSGDPSLSNQFHEEDPTRVFQAWADSLKALGVTRIEGDIIGDDDVFDDVPLGFGWTWNDEVYYYSAEISGLSFNENVVEVSIQGTQTGRPGAVSWEPFNTSYIDVVNETETIPAGGSIDEGYQRARGTNHIRLSSSVPAGKTDEEGIAVFNPTRYFAHVLTEQLQRSGISVSGQPVDVDDLDDKPAYGSADLRRVATYVSPKLSEMTRVLNKESNNLYAEQFLKTLGAESPLFSAETEGASAHRGAQVVRLMLGGIGVDTTDIVIADGSGLSRRDLVTPEATSRLLRHMWSHPDDSVRIAFYESLPIGGVDGTLDNRFKNGPGHRNVRAKTGSLSGVSSLAGYVRSDEGTPLVFVLMSNSYTTRTATIRAAQDRIVNLLASYRR